MDAWFILTLVVFYAVTYALAFGAGTVLVKVLSGPWRRTAGAHWTERARLAFAPGFAVLWLAVVLPPVISIVGETGLEFLDLGTREGTPGFWMPWLAALAGVLTARYRWLRELWGARVTLRSWLAGCLIVLLVFVPYVMIPFLLVYLLPEIPNWRSGVVMGAGILAVAFFACGGGVLLLRLLRVARLAPPHVIEMGERLAQEMKVPGRIKVFELEWAQVNAVAWVLYRAIGFSRPLLAIMTEDEVRAVAAHELAHLLEPKWVRTVRVVHCFAYLPVAPLMRYGGALGPLAGWGLTMAILLSYQRFTRLLEIRADQVERETISDPTPYMHSMTKLHEANLAPAVMPGSQTHPHLYDRLLAGGIQPEFARPMAPSRAGPLLGVLAATTSATVVMFVMGAFLMVAAVGYRMSARHMDPTADLPKRFKTQEEVSKPDFTEAAKDQKFQEAIQEAADLLGAQPQPLKSEAEDVVVEGGVSFDVPKEKIEAILFKLHTNFVAKGFYLFRYQLHFGINEQPDKVGLLPTRDKYAVIAAMDTNGDNYGISTADIIAWMKEMEQEQPFVLTGIGFDYMEGNFTSPVKDPLGLAKRMYQFCPDIVDQGVRSVPALAGELRKGKLYFGWD